MSTLIKNAQIVDTTSSFNQKTADVLIQKGKILKIDKNISDSRASVIDAKGKYLSPGWVDTLADYCEPGYEYKETIDSGLNCALNSGFSDVIIVPNTEPKITNTSGLNFIKQKALGHNGCLHILGALSKNIEGKELAEMMDMHHAGAIGFSDGWKPLQDAMIMLKAMEYVKAFDGIILQIPVHDSLSQDGLMNESENSMRLGMPGIPDISESLIIHRDLELLRYTQSRLHFSGVSTKAGLELIKNAKKEGLNVTCSVTPYHLLYNDDKLSDYDNNFKLNPPLRTEKDRKALIKGLKDGVVDCIATHHHPQDFDSKNKEFEYCGWGLGIQETSWSMLIEAVPDLNVEQWVNLLCIKPREIFGISQSAIEEGFSDSLTLFDFDTEWTYQGKNKKSKSVNNPFINQKLKGKASVIM